MIEAGLRSVRTIPSLSGSYLPGLIPAGVPNMRGCERDHRMGPAHTLPGFNIGSTQSDSLTKPAQPIHEANSLH
jgi:hypothetical protein